MPFGIVRNDITKMTVDAIVNTVNPKPVIGSGTDAGIHAKAGPALLEARKKIGNIPVGCSVITPGFGLDAKYVIHTVGPVWQGGGHGEENLLRQCYDSALNLALENKCESIAFPLISTGNYGFPKDRALQIAISAFSTFLMEHEMQIFLVVFHQDAFRLSEKLFNRVASYIDENYVQAKETAEYGASFRRKNRSAYRRRRDMEVCESSAVLEELLPCASKAMSLDDALKQMDESFSEMLLRKIDEKGMKDSECYKKANIDRKLFSKIRSDRLYKPSKPTVLAFAIALELPLDETKDMLQKAGFALSHSNKFDIIVEYFIRNGKYDIYEINETLFAFDQSLLGG